MSDQLNALEQSFTKLLDSLKPLFAQSGPAEVSAQNRSAIHEALLETDAALELLKATQATQHALSVKVAALEAELLPYREAEERERLAMLRRERLREIVDILFPKYDSLRYRNRPDEKPLVHPERDWWWNGAKIISEGAEIDGFVEVEVESYVGGGEMDEVELKIPVAWLTAEDPKADIHAWMKAETARKKAEQHQAEIEAARKAIEAQTRKLTELEGTPNT
jgi:hypothetical protein